jgi:hypothetical protein
MRAPRWIVALIALCAAVMLLAWSVDWESNDPVQDLPTSDAIPRVIEATTQESDSRLIEHITLFDERLGQIGLTVSLPRPLPSTKLPVVMVLGGLGSGEHNVRSITDAGDNAILGYDWPLPERMPAYIGPWHLLELRKQIFRIPGQVVSALRWAGAQEWAEPDRLTLIGFSLGAVAAPAVQQIAGSEHVRVGWTVLAFGGAPISAIIGSDQRLRPSWLRPFFAWGGQMLLKRVDPAVHLPHLYGQFLTLDAAQDTIVGSNASMHLEELTPEPKTIVHLPGDHVGTGPDRAAELRTAISATCGWLVAHGAINPIAGSSSSGDSIRCFTR